MVSDIMEGARTPTGGLGGGPFWPTLGLISLMVITYIQICTP